MSKILALSAACALAWVPASVGAVDYVGSGPGTTNVSTTDGTTTFTYSDNSYAIHSGESWTLSGVADDTGTVTFNYESSGFYDFFNVRASMTAFSGADSQTVYSTGPNNCCSSPSNGFDYSGTVTLDLVAGQAYGFTVSGSNSDSAVASGGTLTISEAGPVPEPASWAMMLGGFGMLGGVLRRKRVAIRFA